MPCEMRPLPLAASLTHSTSINPLSDHTKGSNGTHRATITFARLLLFPCSTRATLPIYSETRHVRSVPTGLVAPVRLNEA